MNTISEFLTLLKTDKDLNSLILNSEALRREYKPKKRKKGGVISSKAGLAAKYFWTSLDGVKFRHLLEVKYEVNIANVKIISAVKDALLLYISEVMGQ